MENCNGSLAVNGGVGDSSGLQIIKHPLYHGCNKPSLSWLDIRVFYIRFSSFMAEGSTPESLTVKHLPLSPDTLLEVNGARWCSMYPEGGSCILRRDRVDKKSEETTFVSTDSVRLTGSVKFLVFDRDDLVLSGVLEVNGGESKNSMRKWSMNCETMMSAGCGFSKGKQINGSESHQPPTIEVFVTGCFSGTPIILTKSLQLLNNRKKHHRNGMLGSIPEDGTYGAQKHDVSSGLDHLQVTESNSSYKPECEEDDYNNTYWGVTEDLDGEDGELSWFNAGVRVGVGIGLGICVGVGIGVGLLVSTYQSATRGFRRRFV
ncbi:unnamed protein product [Cuscuta campestris]|uniref:Erythronate-4-phosphate dehydrogenase family protein n=1 Tax=Cuscuta campestris TaxID=132261 RepID=A0A484NK82_9ASTE|nr:unnamed protein product [Cuscuta campestris]